MKNLNSIFFHEIKINWFVKIYQWSVVFDLNGVVIIDLEILYFIGGCL